MRLVPRARQWWAWVVSAFMFLPWPSWSGCPSCVLLLGSFTRLFGFFFIKEPWTTEHWSTVLNSEAFLEATKNSLIIGLVVAGLGTLHLLGAGLRAGPVQALERLGASA